MVQFNIIATLYLGVEPLESFWNLVVVILWLMKLLCIMGDVVRGQLTP